VISKRGLFERAAKFPDARTALQVWLETASAAHWNSLEDIRKTFPATDMIGKNLAIFNIRGGHYRLIVRMEFAGQRIFIKEFLTHGEYDRKVWMKWL
jgi:mRNA interferase HigB